MKLKPINISALSTLRHSFIESVVHEPYTPCGARWKGTTQIGNAPRHSVEHYRDQISLIRPDQFIWTPYAHCILSDYCNDVNGCSLCETYLDAKERRSFGQK
ncbi:uncharacterized protein LOC121778984 [Salvia splendens]|uniref:uncharacterized protein LOC121778984 n=1 Tax=Salvia splendens TaxID=180675 RepID=UPI001C26353C|nr:uncharacterized protein LOC121778984 [Salvia splendens]